MGKEKKADFISIVCWRQQAEFVSRYFSKGKAIGIEGSIQTRDYTDKNGDKRHAVEVVADRVFFVGGKGSDDSNNQPSQQAAYTPTQSGFEVVDDESDLPF